MKKIAAAAVLIAGIGLGMSQNVTKLCDGFLPENNMRIPVGWTFAEGGGITEAQFNEVINKAEKLYKEEIAAKGGTLQVNRLWEDETVNASAQREGTTWVVNMYGGLARHPATTRDGFALVICHELGHHLGGAPRYQSFGQLNWASNEGQADYSANLKCLRRFFSDEDNQDALSRMNVDQVARQTCEGQFTEKLDQQTCIRGSMAGMSVAGIFQALRSETNPPRFDTPDQAVVTKTDDRHPGTQCRLDTYFAGSICQISNTISTDANDFKIGTCHDANETKLGLRPNCWFNAASSAMKIKKN